MELKYKPNKLQVLFFIFILGVLFTGVAQAKTITVCSNGCDYMSIQSAINGANIGDTIKVQSGTYNENVNVTKQLIMRGIDTGAGKPVVNADGSGSAITLSAEGITLEGFEATNSGSSWRGIDSGIYVTSDNNVIKNNKVSNNYHGIYLYFSNNNNLSNNTVSNNSRDGILLWYSSNNSIYNNTMVGGSIVIYGVFLEYYTTQDIDTTNTVNGRPIYFWKNKVGGKVPEGSGEVILANCKNILIENQNLNNGSIGLEIAYSSNIIIINNTANSNNITGIDLKYSSNNFLYNNIVSKNNLYGINLWYSSNNFLYNNKASNNFKAGIYLDYSSNNLLYNNKASNNLDGIDLWNSGKNNIYNNKVSNNNGYGIFLWYSSNNSLYNNTANSNFFDGISLESSSKNTITNNKVSNSFEGIDLDYSSNDNIIYLNNFINNIDNVHSFKSTNLWNSQEKITYTYNGNQYTNYLGNYWSDYTGTDTDNNGIGDTTYIIEEEQDNYPLMEPFENYLEETPTPKRPPIAEFIYSPFNTSVNQEITFDGSYSSDPDGEIIKYEWDFGDGNKANGISTTHSYSLSGSYNVTLTVTDDGGARNSKSKVITIQSVSDTTPPSSITNLQYTSGQNWINWTWTDPIDRDFSKVMVYIDGSFRTNVSKGIQYYNATGFAPDTLHTIATRTVDTSGNFNQTWVNNSVRTAPIITQNQKPIANFIYSPENPVVNQTITFNASSSYDPDGNITLYKWDFGDNTTKEGVIVNHSYSKEGSYTVTLTVTDNENANNSLTELLNIKTIKGDFNGNGKVDLGDATYVAYMVVGKVQVNMDADFNNNGIIDIGDASKIAYYVVGKVKSL